MPTALVPLLALAMSCSFCRCATIASVVTSLRNASANSLAAWPVATGSAVLAGRLHPAMATTAATTVNQAVTAAYVRFTAARVDADVDTQVGLAACRR